MYPCHDLLNLPCEIETFWAIFIPYALVERMPRTNNNQSGGRSQAGMKIGIEPGLINVRGAPPFIIDIVLNSPVSRSNLVLS